MTKTTPASYKVLSLPVIIAALGYFVDIYDLVLFSIVQVLSLKALAACRGGVDLGALGEN